MRSLVSSVPVARALDSRLETETGGDSASEDLNMLRGHDGWQGSTTPLRSSLLWRCSMLMAATGAVAATMYSFTRSSATKANAEALAGLSKTQRSGCSNWNQILLEEHLDVELYTCKKLCQDLPGCVHYNYQTYECVDDPANGRAPSTCYLFAEGCQEHEARCWDLYPNSQYTPSYFLNSSRMGCTNWAEILLAKYTPDTSPSVMSVAQCSHMCNQTADCAQFNYQPLPCSGSEQNSADTCYLYKAACLLEQNPCWDLYNKVTVLYSSDIVLNSKTGSKVIYVASGDMQNYPVGSYICIRQGSYPHEVVCGTRTARRRLTEAAPDNENGAPANGSRLVGRIELNVALPFDVVPGDEVYRVEEPVLHLPDVTTASTTGSADSTTGDADSSTDAY